MMKAREAASGAETLEPTHFVHVYATIRVKVAVRSANHREAMAQADRSLFANGFGIRLIPTCAGAIEADYAEEVTGYLVDEIGDPGHDRSETYDANFQLERPRTKVPWTRRIFQSAKRLLPDSP